jgi:hypothetical protein
MDLSSEVPFQPIFSQEAAVKVESNDVAGVSRRITNMSLTRSSDDYIESFMKEHDPEVLIEIAEFIRSYREHLTTSLQLADLAYDRIVNVLEEISDIKEH